MRINRVHIDGFGEYANTDLPEFAKPVTVIFGPNEAGKSTLLAFIQTVLFGFPIRGSAVHFPPLAGGTHGGRLEIVTDSNERFTISRHKGKAGGTISIIGADASPIAESALPGLLGHAPKSTFKSVFAFDLDELQQLESGDDSGINSRLYTAGTGAAKLPAALKQLKERADEIYTARGGTRKPVSKALAELQAIEARLQESQSQSLEYGQAEARTVELANEVERLQAKRTAVSSGLEDLDRRQRSWETWRAWIEVEDRLKTLPAQPEFPEDPIARLEGLEERLREAESSVEVERDELARAERAREEVLADDELLQESSAIEAIRRDRGGFDASVRDLPKRKAELVRDELELSNALRDLGADWSEERLAEFDTSVPRRHEVQQWKDRLAALDDDVREANLEAERASVDAEEANQDLQDAEEAVMVCALPAVSEEQLVARRAALPATRSRLIEYEQAEQRRRDLESRGDPTRAPAEPLARRALPGAMGAVGAALIAAGVAAEMQIAALAAGLALLAAAAIVYMLFRNPARGGSSSGLEGLAEESARFAAQKREALIAAAHPLDLEELIGALPGHDDLDRLEVVLSEQEALGRERDRLVTASGDAGKVRERRRTSLKEAQRRGDESRRSSAALLAEWSAWLAARSLPETLTPETVTELLSRAEGTRPLARTTNERRGRIAAIQNDIDNYASRVVPLATRYLEGLADTSFGPIGRAADQLVERLETVRTAVAKRDELEGAAADCRARLAQAETRRGNEGGRLHELLALAQTDDTEEFRRRARQHVERQSLEQQRHEHSASLRMVWGSECSPDELRKLFDAMTKEEVDHRLSEAETHVAELSASIEELNQERGGLQERMKSLSNDEQASRLRAHRQQLIEELRTLTFEWSKNVLARSLLVRARKQYEEERQPDVVRRAQTFFRSLTGGRYSRLHVTIGEQDITVIDEGGRQKTPDQLSRGTREQLYLALRFGLIQSMGETAERLPVVVDEVLVNFDKRRARQAASTFVELAKTNQVLVLTCHQWIVDLFMEAAKGEAGVINLEDVRAKPHMLL